MDAPPIPNTHLAGVGLGSDGFAFAEAVLAAAPVIVLVLDPRGHIIHYNAFMERLCGRPIAHARGLDWFREFVLEEDRATLLTCFAQVHDVSRSSSRDSLGSLVPGAPQSGCLAVAASA